MENLKIVLAILIVVVFYSCNKDDGSKIEPGKAIIISASGNDVKSGIITKAAPAFPNNGEIAVIAGYYTNGVPVDWTSYNDISNTRATVGSVTTDSVYSFTWDTPKYWPFDNRPLAFMAYSPLADNTSVFLDASNSVLLMILHENMPDVLYASANDTSTIVGYSKIPTVPVVNLGEFRHALSKLTIELVADTSMPAQIEVTSLKVATKKKSAQYWLQLGDNGLSVTNDDDNFIYDVVSTATQFKNNSIRKAMYLFPGTEDYTEITLELFDGIITFSRTYLMSFFQTGTDLPVKLEAGKNTTLRLTVKGIPTAGGEISLQGSLTGWNQRGEFGVNIF